MPITFSSDEVETANPDEKSILKTLKDRAVQALEADLLESASQLGLTQVVKALGRLPLLRIFRLCLGIGSLCCHASAMLA